MDNIYPNYRVVSLLKITTYRDLILPICAKNIRIQHNKISYQKLNKQNIYITDGKKNLIAKFEKMNF